MSFIENFYLRTTIQKLQEENQNLKRLIREYDFDYMADVDLPPFDPKNPQHSASTGDMAANVLHTFANDLYAQGHIPRPLPHPNTLTPDQLVQYLVHVQRAVHPDQQTDVESLVSEVLAQRALTNVDLHNFGGAAGQTGAVDPRYSPVGNYAIMRSGGRLPGSTP